MRKATRYNLFCIAPYPHNTAAEFPANCVVLPKNRSSSYLPSDMFVLHCPVSSEIAEGEPDILRCFPDGTDNWKKLLKSLFLSAFAQHTNNILRSEERRVGKDGKYRWLAYRKK